MTEVELGEIRARVEDAVKYWSGAVEARRLVVFDMPRLLAEIDRLRASRGPLLGALWQLLDDMGEHGLSVCLFAKAKARVAYAPFDSEPEGAAGFMSVETAKQVLRDSNYDARARLRTAGEG